MDKTIGFIGVGNMGGAILKSVAQAGIVDKKRIFAYDISIASLTALEQELGISKASDLHELVSKSDIIILGVKPNVVDKVLKECAEDFTANTILVSIAVGLPIELYKSIIGDNRKIVRAMPNTPALVGEGMTLISYEEDFTQEDIKTIKEIFECTGKVEVLEEKYMSEVTALTGSSPAYVFMFIEAMADAAVLSGLPRALSYKLAAQSVLGSAKMVLETGKHPGELKDQVCSPAGTTIEAVSVLEQAGMRSAIIQAMTACTERAREIGRQMVEGK